MDRPLLDFERLDVYRCAIDFLALAVRVTAHMPRGQADLRDQLRRAAAATSDVDQGKLLLSRVVAMLSKMCR